MSWRSVLALLLLAFAGGAGAFAWLNSSGPASTSEATESSEAPPPLAATAFPLPSVIQPSASQAESLLLIANARRKIEAGKPLGDLGTRLQVSFGQSQPQALATIADASRKPLSNATLLAGFDAISSGLAAPAGTAWDRIQYELSTLFILRRADAKPSASAARIARAREAIVAGDIGEAARIVRAMPGAERARDWLLQAKKAILVQQAFDALSVAVAATPAPAPAAAEPAPETSPPPAKTESPAAPATPE